MTRKPGRQKAAYVKIRAEIERGLKDADPNASVHESFLCRATDSGPTRRDEKG